MPKANQPTALIKRKLIVIDVSVAAGANHVSVTGPMTTEVGRAGAHGGGLLEGVKGGVDDGEGVGLSFRTCTVAVGYWDTIASSRIDANAGVGAVVLAATPNRGPLTAYTTIRFEDATRRAKNTIVFEDKSVMFRIITVQVEQPIAFEATSMEKRIFSVASGVKRPASSKLSAGSSPSERNPTAVDSDANTPPLDEKDGAGSGTVSCVSESLGEMVAEGVAEGVDDGDSIWINDCVRV